MKQKITVLVFGAVLIVVLFILIAWILLSFQERSRINEIRHNIYCQRIVPGKSLLQVRNILSEYGDFNESETSFKGGLVAVGINFIDQTVNEKFGNGNIVLVYEDGYLKDVREPIPMSDSYRFLCQQERQ